VKIGPLNSEIIGLRTIIKKEINASKTYSPSGKFAKRAKREQYNSPSKRGGSSSKLVASVACVYDILTSGVNIEPE